MTQSTAGTQQTTDVGRSAKGRESALARQSPLSTGEGRISIAQNVVQKIAGMACREMPGVHAMGTGGNRAFASMLNCFLKFLFIVFIKCSF